MKSIRDSTVNPEPSVNFDMKARWIEGNLVSTMVVMKTGTVPRRDKSMACFFLARMVFVEVEDEEVTFARMVEPATALRKYLGPTEGWGSYFTLSPIGFLSSAGSSSTNKTLPSKPSFSIFPMDVASEASAKSNSHTFNPSPSTPKNLSFAVSSANTYGSITSKMTESYPASLISSAIISEVRPQSFRTTMSPWCNTNDMSQEWTALEFLEERLLTHRITAEEQFVQVMPDMDRRTR